MKRLEDRSKFTNRYLDKITSFDEKKVAGYQSQVKMQLFHPWMDALLLFVLLQTALAFVSAILVVPFLSIPQPYQNLVIAGIHIIAVFVYAAIMASVRVKKFIHLNNGEVCHKRKPYWNKVSFMILIGLAFAAATVIGIWIFFEKAVEAEGYFPDLLSKIGEYYSEGKVILCAGLYPLFYYLMTKLKMRSWQRKNVCPCCGRIDSVAYAKRSEFGYSKTNNYTKDIYVRAQVGTEYTTTTTTYGDGHKESYTSSKPIYGDVYDHTDLHEVGTYLAEYVEYCTSCSYYREILSENKYDKNLGKV